MTLGMMSLFGFAQDIDEMELAGTEWGLTESEGEFIYERNNLSCLKPDSIYFYNEDKHVEEPESLGVVKYQTEEYYCSQNINKLTHKKIIEKFKFLDNIRVI